MVEYVLGGSPTNKDSPLALDGRFKNLKIDEVKVSFHHWFNFYYDSKAYAYFSNQTHKGNDDKDANSSPFDTNNGLKKDEVNASNGANGLDDDKGFKWENNSTIYVILKKWLNYSQINSSRTPGSRQPSPAEEHLNRLHGLDPSLMNVGGFSQPHMMQHMLNNHDQQQMNSSFHNQHQQHHAMGHPVMNGMQVQVTELKFWVLFCSFNNS